MKKVQAINNRQLAITKSKALFALITPAGISLIAVRGFFASKFLSSQRLKAMAAERAKIMQRITRINNFAIPQYDISQLIRGSSFKKIKNVFPSKEKKSKAGVNLKKNSPKKNPINAKGIAKIVCENFTRLR